jgi:hypothetical protein
LLGSIIDVGCPRAMVVQTDENVSQAVPSRNIDELKRLVITALDRNGVLSELRTTVKMHVTRAINEETNQLKGGSGLVHHRGDKLAGLMSTERGQLLTELVVEFLRYYDLNDTLSMFLVEGNLPRLRPSEGELATQCGFRFSPTTELSVLEQYLTHQPGVHFAPQQTGVASRFDTQISSDTVSDTGLNLNHVGTRSPVEDGLEIPDDDGGVRGQLNTSLEKDMNQMRRISNEINRISDSKRFDDFSGSDASDSPRYEDDFESSPTENGLLGLDASPLQSRSQGFSNPIDDNVLFESRESFKDLGESPARKHPIDLSDHIESLDRSPH